MEPNILYKSAIYGLPDRAANRAEPQLVVKGSEISIWASKFVVSMHHSSYGIVQHQSSSELHVH